MSTTISLKTTPLHQTHAKMGAKLVPFAGWDMPVQYTKVRDEHLAVRERAGLFDVSHMGVFTLSADSADDVATFLNAMVPNDVSAIVDGQAQYTQLLNEDGGIIDDLIIYRTGFDSSFEGFDQWFIICNAGNAEADFSWLQQYCPASVTLTNVSEAYSLLALQGPQFKAVLGGFGLEENEANMLPERFGLKSMTIEGIDTLVCRTGYTGEDGVELLVAADQVVTLWHALLRQGAEFGLIPCGLAARDTLRLEAAYPLHGNDITTETSPLEAGLGWSVKLDKEDEFIGKAALVQQKEAGVPRQFVCLMMDGKPIARAHTPICHEDGVVIGEVTSGTFTPSLKRPIAMGYVQREFAGQVGDTFYLDIRGKQHSATRVKRPFYKGI